MKSILSLGLVLVLALVVKQQASAAEHQISNQHEVKGVGTHSKDWPTHLSGASYSNVHGDTRKARRAPRPLIAGAGSFDKQGSHILGFRTHGSQRGYSQDVPHASKPRSKSIFVKRADEPPQKKQKAPGSPKRGGPEYIPEPPPPMPPRNPPGNPPRVQPGDPVKLRPPRPVKPYPNGTPRKSRAGQRHPKPGETGKMAGRQPWAPGDPPWPYTPRMRRIEPTLPPPDKGKGKMPAEPSTGKPRGGGGINIPGGGPAGGGAAGGGVAGGGAAGGSGSGGTSKPPVAMPPWKPAPVVPKKPPTQMPPWKPAPVIPKKPPTQMPPWRPVPPKNPPVAKPPVEMPPWRPVVPKHGPPKPYYHPPGPGSGSQPGGMMPMPPMHQDPVRGAHPQEPYVPVPKKPQVPGSGPSKPPGPSLRR